MKAVNKLMRQQSGKGNPYHSSDMDNKAGGQAWSKSDSENVTQLMMTGTMGNTFYATQKELVKSTLELFERVAQTDPATLAKACVKGRNEGFIRTAPIMGLVMLSIHSTENFKNIFNDVIRTGNDLEDFMNMRVNMNRGFGRAIKTTIHKWLDKKATPFYAMKYGRQLQRAIRVSRPKAKPIYAYILDGSTDVSEQNVKIALEEHPQLHAYETAKMMIEEDKWNEAIELITTNRLDPLSLTGIKNPPSEVWKALAGQMGTMAYMKFLNKLLKVDALEEQTLKNKIQVQNLQAAKVLPFRLFTAYDNIHPGSYEGQTVLNHLAETLDRYVDAYDWGKWNKKFVIAPDVSGSMTWVPSSFDGHRQSNIIPAKIAGMLTGILYKGIKNSIVIPWDTEIHPHRVPKSDSVMSHINAITNANGGGTHMATPVFYMREHEIDCDVFMLITDSEEWGHGWLNSWMNYKMFNPKAKAVLIRIDPYNTNPFDQQTAEKYDIFQVYGWTDSVLKYIEEYVL